MQRSDNIIELEGDERQVLCGVLKDYIKMAKTVMEYEGDFDGSITTSISKYRNMIEVLED